jgi:hypothetical protein
MPDSIRWVGLDVHAREPTLAVFDQAAGEVATRRAVGRPHELLAWLRGKTSAANQAGSSPSRSPETIRVWARDRGSAVFPSRSVYGRKCPCLQRFRGSATGSGSGRARTSRAPKRVAYAIVDVVTRYWIGYLLTTEQPTQAQLLFARALEDQRLLGRTGSRPIMVPMTPSWWGGLTTARI